MCFCTSWTAGQGASVGVLRRFSVSGRVDDFTGVQVDGDNIFSWEGN